MEQPVLSISIWTGHSCILTMPYPRRYFIILRCSTFYDFNAAEVFLLVPKAWGGKAAWASFKVWYYSNYVPPVSTTTVVQAAKFAAGVIDTVGAPWLANLYENLWKKFEKTLMLFLGAWGKMIHEKNLKQNISWHCPFNSSGVQTYQAAQFGKELA